MRCLRNRGFHRRVARRGGKPGVALISARDRADRVEDGDVYDRHRAARAGRAELLAEDARFSIRHWRVIEAARVDRDFVPVPDHSPRGRIVARSAGRALRVWIVAVERSQRVFHAIAKSLRLRPGRKQNAGNDKRSGADAGEASDKPMIAGGGRIHGRAFRTYEDQSAQYGFVGPNSCGRAGSWCAACELVAPTTFGQLRYRRMTESVAVLVTPA